VALEARIVEFAELLRQNGVRVSPGEVEDAVRALREVGLASRETVRAALASTLVKRSRDRFLFDRVFDLYFSPWGSLGRALDESLARQIEEEGLLQGDELEMLLYELRSAAEGMSPFARALLLGEGASLFALLRGASLRLDLASAENTLQAGFLSRRLLAEAGAEAARRELGDLEKKLRAKLPRGEVVDLVAGALAEKLRAAERAARDYVEARARLVRARKEPRSSLEKPFGELVAEELERVQLAVRRLAKRLESRLVKKDRRRRKGSLNVRKTLRRNMALDGSLVDLAFRQRKRQRPEVMVLCDVSDSVRNVSRMMLLFVHTLQAQFAGVRSFAFVSDVGEITEAFREADANQALDVALAGKAIDRYGNSNYGRMLTQFVGRYLPSVTRRTTVLVIGDARNNYNDPAVWALQAIAKKARRVVWITPEPEEAWGAGDSEMLRYRDAVSRVVVVEKLADLEGLADKLVA